MIISFVNDKGGVAKTTSAIHFAAALQQKGNAVVVVDSDPNHTALDWGNRAPNSPFPVITEMDLFRYAGRFEHAITDTKARPDKNDLEALLRNSDLLVVSTSPKHACLKTTIQFIQRLQDLGSQKHRVLLTRVPPRSQSRIIQIQSMLAEAGISFFKAYIREYDAYDQAQSMAVPVFEVKNENAQKAWSDYQAAIQEIMGDGNAKGIKA